MADYYQVKNQNIFNPPPNTNMGNTNSQFNSMYVQNALVLGNVSVTGSTIVAPRVSAIAYPGDDTAADTAGGQTITLTGSGFVAGASVLINGSAVGVVSVVSSTSITFTSPANSTGSYVIYVINPDGSTAISIPGIQYSGTPTWTTAAGSLGSVYETNIFNQTVTATGDAPISYSVFSGSIPPGATFNSNGTITGTSQTLSSSTTYTFTARATDAQLQDTNRSFSLTITPDVVTWNSPANNTTYTQTVNTAISNVVLSATSAAGFGIVYTANSLPTGLSINSANIAGTPTVIANTSSLLTATANSSGKTSTQVINWVVASLVPTTVNYLVVGGGGGGSGGGGGAGGYRTASGFAVASGTPITVTVGTGGAAGTQGSDSATSGSNSVFGSITSIGGGGGGGGYALTNGLNGGSGGGGSLGSGYTGTATGGTATSGQGNAGGSATASSYYGWVGAGGGGAGAVGASASNYDTGASPPYGALGGAGLASSITGSSVMYAAGGQAYYSSTVSADAPANSGNGGGGSRSSNAVSVGWNGGSGIVIISYPSNYNDLTSVGAGLTYTKTTAGGNKIYTFTAGTGTITV